MALSKVSRLVLRFKDLYRPDFFRYLLKAGWLFFPAIMFLAFAYGAFWYVVQGKDLMVITLEDLEGIKGFGVFTCFIISLFFWIYVTWYSTRLVAKAKDFQSSDSHNMWKIFKEQAPRILGFSCITILLLAFFQLDNPNYPHLSRGICQLLLLFSFIWYFIIFNFWKRILGKENVTKEAWLRYLRRLRRVAIASLLAWLTIVIILKNFWALISLLIGWQIGLVLLLMIRREIIEENKRLGKLTILPFNSVSRFPFFKKFWYIASDKEDRAFFKWFCYISIVAFGIYLLSVYKFSMADFIGSFPFILLAFGVLLGIGNLITFGSVIAKINLHIFFYIWAIFIGFLADSHYAKIVNKQNKTAYFNNRMNLKEYFRQWLNDPDRRENIEQADSLHRYPVYFVLANGGASRSGYWTASVLSKLEDTTNGNFSKHLYCLSGASGGSVGNASFFNLLRLKNNAGSKKLTADARDFLSSDFLTYTLSHLLCSDIFRNVFPANNVKDRAAALAFALENASSKNNLLYHSFETGFSNIITQKDQPYHLPILCINTTRMQKGTPGVVTNINIENDSYFDGRLDLLSLLDEAHDIKMSTAVVLGASFPYICPAGRINKTTCDNNGKNCKDTSYYFVDGGYFDNSGAGFVNEMMIEMNYLLQNDVAFSGYKNKLQFMVLHITNTDPKKLQTGTINPLTNDLLAPVKTLMSSYGSQTTVNDKRLKNYLATLCRKHDTDICTHYTDIDLYSAAGYFVLKNKRDTMQMQYSMNWVISAYQRQSMDLNLANNKDFQKTCMEMLQFNNTVKK